MSLCSKSSLVGVLALQGAFREHARALISLGTEVREVRKPEDLQGLQGLVLPGGESTTMGKLLVEWELMQPIKDLHAEGLPIFGTCAGLILLCTHIEGSVQPRLGLLDATVRRNAFGRQVDSFECLLPVEGMAQRREDSAVEAVFIRAPLITAVGPGVRVLGRLRGVEGESIVLVRQGALLAASFHPELTEDTRLHQYFLEMVESTVS